MKRLFIYIDPGYLSNGGHYRKFAEKIHPYSERKGITVLHYVGVNVKDNDIEEFGLIRKFQNTAYFAPNLPSDVLDDRKLSFSESLEQIFTEVREKAVSYDEVAFFMYTSHPIYMQIFAELSSNYEKENWQMHLALFYLNNAFCMGEEDKRYKALLKETNSRLEKLNNIQIYMDSDIAINIYQPYFTNKIKLIGFPLYTKEYLNSLEDISNNTNKIRIGFFGNATYKHGFDKIYKLITADKDKRYEFVLKVNLDMHKNNDLLAFLDELRTFSNVTIYDKYIDEFKAYLPLLKSCDIVVIPYSEKEYPVQTSGPFIESIVHKKTVYTTEKTWMASKVEYLGMGYSFSSVKGLLQLVKQYDRNKIRINEMRWLKFINYYTVGQFMKTFSNEEAPFDTNGRKKVYETFNLHSWKLRHQKGEDYPLAEFVTYPVISTKEKLADVVNRLSFALTGNNKIQVKLYVDKKLMKTKLTELQVAKGQANYCNNLKMFELISTNVEKELLDRRILIHEYESLEEDIIFDNAHKVKIIDPHYYSVIESIVLRELLFTTLTAKKKEILDNKSRLTFQKMLEENKEKNKAYCFASGPSFDNYQEYDIDKAAFKVICNSIVKNVDFIDHIGGADLLVFADPVFHFGVSKYAEKFRQDVIKYIKKTPSYVLVPDYTVPMLLGHYPLLKEYLIGMPIESFEQYNFPSEEKFAIKATSNILTLFMLPVASAISNTITVFGADGREKSETYFWKHSKSAQYNDKMEDAFTVHPSFFRDRDYEDYYEEHCSLLDQLLQYGEGLGKKYFSLSKSFVPALKSRFIGRSFLSIQAEKVYKYVIKVMLGIKRKGFNFLLRVKRKLVSFIPNN